VFRQTKGGIRSSDAAQVATRAVTGDKLLQVLVHNTRLKAQDQCVGKGPVPSRLFSCDNLFTPFAVMSSSVPTTVHRPFPSYPSQASRGSLLPINNSPCITSNPDMPSAHFPLSKMDADQAQDAPASSTCTFCACTLDSCQGPPISLGVPLDQSFRKHLHKP
jgi:hypothetical protein